jgi:hypothetical protein
MLHLGGRGRRGEATRLVGGAGAARNCETKQRPWRQLGYREKSTGRIGRAAREREEWKDGVVAWLGTSRGSPWWPERQAGGGRRWPCTGHAGADCLSEEDKG